MMSWLMQTYNRCDVVFVQGAGLKLYTATGEIYWDYLSGIGVNNLGHCHPAVVNAVKEQAGKLLHVSNLYRIAQQEALAEELAAISGLDRVFFCNSGAEANEAMIKLARRYQREVRGEDRFEVITALNSFHGRTYGALAATGQPKYQRGFEPLGAGFKYVPYNDLAALEEAISPQTALVLLEPVQGEGGIYPATREYLEGVSRLCREHGVLLGLDEVQTGVGRCGSFYAYQRMGIRPDLVSSAKALAGGLPIGALLATAEVAQGFVPGTHASTFGGGPLVTAAALAVVRIVKQQEFLEEVEKIGGYLEAAILAAAGDDIVELRRLGLMLGIQFGPAVEVKQLNQALFNKEKILANALANNTLRLLPPLIATEADCDRFAEALARQIKDLKEGQV